MNSKHSVKNGPGRQPLPDLNIHFGPAPGFHSKHQRHISKDRQLLKTVETAVTVGEKSGRKIDLIMNPSFARIACRVIFSSSISETRRIPTHRAKRDTSPPSAFLTTGLRSPRASKPILHISHRHHLTLVIVDCGYSTVICHNAVLIIICC